MRRLLLAAMILSAAACGIERPSLESLLGRQPRVVAVEPASGAVVRQDALVAVEFSHPIEPTSVDAATLAVIEAGEEGGDEGVAASVMDGKAVGVSGTYSFDGEGRVAVFRAASPYRAGGRYEIVATPEIMSVEMIPLSQGIAGRPKAFVSEFLVEGDGGPSGGGEAGSPAESGGDGGETADAGGVDGASGGSSGTGSAAAPARPGAVVINELLYDVPGDDTDGLLFIELAGDAGGDISGYKVAFVNGDDGKATETISIPAGSRIGADGIFLIGDSRTGQAGVTQVAGCDLVDNFDPQNGPDCVQLLDQNGALLDALGYGTPIVAKAEGGLSCFEGGPAAKPPSGSSLSRTATADTGDNAADFKALPAPTPGAM